MYILAMGTSEATYAEMTSHLYLGKNVIRQWLEVLGEEVSTGFRIETGCSVSIMSTHWPRLLGSNPRRLGGGLPHSPCVSRSNSWCRSACWSESLGLVEGSRSDPDWSSSNHNIFSLLIIPLIYYIFYSNFIPDSSMSVSLVQVHVAFVLGGGKGWGVALNYFNKTFYTVAFYTVMICQLLLL